MAEITKQTPAPPLAPATDVLSLEERQAVLKIPVWKVRLQLAWRGLRTNFALFAENPVGLVGVAIIVWFGLMALAHPLLMETVWDQNTYHPVSGYDLSIEVHPAPPSAAHLLGTDPLGRDVLSQLMWSTRSEFALGIIAALVTVIIATTIGAVTAYFGGLVDTLFMRFADLIIMTPFVTVLIVLSALFDVTLVELALIIGILSGFGAATVIIKSQALTIKVRDNGRGVTLEQLRRAKSHGVLGMSERARHFGGKLEIGPIRAGGTRVRVWLPFNENVERNNDPVVDL